MLISLYVILIQILGSLAENIALNKETFSSSVAWDGVSSRAVDGNRDGIYNNRHCMHTNTNGKQWLLVNLGAVYDIETIDIWSRTDWTDYGKMRNFKVYIGDKYITCQDDLFDSYKLCKSFGNDIQKRQTSINCKKRGQYILVVKGDESSKGDTLIICELEATGRRVTNVKPFKSPDIPRVEKLNDKPMDQIGAYRTITQNTQKVNVHWNMMRLHVLKKSAEPILWLPEKQVIFMAGAQLGKGKVVVVSSGHIWHSIQTGKAPQLTRGIKTWLTGNSNAPLRDMYGIRPVSSVAQGTVVYIRWWAWEPEDRLREAMQLVREGKIGLVLSILEQNNFHFDILMKEIGMYVSSHRKYAYFTEQEDVSVSNMRSNPLFNIESLKDKMLTSYSSFLKYSVLFTTSLKAVPVERLAEVGITKSYVKQLVNKYRDMAEWRLPCESRPVKSKEDKAFTEAYNNLLLASEFLVDSNVKAPGVANYPGDISSPRLINKRVKVTAAVKDEYHSTGLYLPPGHTMTIKLNSGSAKDWYVQIGCWTDRINGREEWTRYPEIHSKHYLTSNKVFSAFGGNILIRNEKVEKGSLDITLSGVVEAPYFNLRDSRSVSNWMSRRNANAPWGEIVGDAINFCLLSKSFKTWDTALMKKFIDDTMDKIVKSNHHLLGRDWRKLRREMIVYDRQISVGYGHSGYPIMGMLDWHAGHDMSKMLKEGNWGVSHELGHNIQDSKFSWSKTGEVTNNIFAIWNNYYVFNMPFFKKDSKIFFAGLIVKIKAYLVTNGARYEHWTDDLFSALSIFPQMANSFGWSLFKNVFRTYWDTKIPQPKNDQEIIDEWMKRSSKAANMNIAPLFDFWGLPLTDNARKSVQKYTCFLPDDFITQIAPDRVNMILRKYSNRCKRSATKVRDIYGPVDLKPLQPNDVVVS